MKIQIVCFMFLWSYAHSSCVTPLGATSECVSLYDCAPLLASFEQRPLPSHVVSFLRQSSCGFEGYVPQVCCGPLPAQTSTSTPRPRPRPTRPPNNNNGQRSPVEAEDSSPAPSDVCGIDTQGDRIYGGQFTDLDEFPWMALMGYRTPSGSITYQCGGVLINRRYILTAAHCVTGAITREVGTLVTVRLGEYDLQSETDCMNDSCADPPVEVPVDSSHPHSGYSDSNSDKRDDIALVRLAQRVKYSYYVQPICLPDGRSRLTVGNDVFVAGWGKTLNGRNSPVKLKLKVPIFEKENCIKKYRTLGAELTSNQICAGGKFAEDACRGDSGGPLMRAKNNGVWESVAVVSFGYGCGRDGWPGVYTSTANYLDWIRSTLQSTNV
ncbi:phenoloxidase-activating enzyme 1-like [Choristoneura fumiferana]|uniref:phenoloxidase-activating enzyme 1-like n=1 Tax=Choristoneura fumiferana TaxID=7141 RepID=UPI003D159B01